VRAFRIYQPVLELDRLNDVEYTPIDPEFAAALRRLLDNTNAFVQLHAVNSFPDKQNDDWRDTGWSDVEGGKYGKYREIFDERRKLLNDASRPLADAYDEFIDIARRKLLLAADDADV
jgi:hypothetical protein